ncbi:hypothetical protein IKG45_02240 [Candidatus Saccharibacteria bacterium]|nr:hypothetical protein [Candidatus Saccharibacteria bacterium]
MDNNEAKPPIETNIQTEAPKKKNNTPVIISAVVVGLLFLVAVILILIFGQKTEEIKENKEEIKSYNLGSFYDTSSTKFDNKIIKTTKELDDFYAELIEAEMIGGYNYDVYEEEFIEYDNEKSSESTLTYCDWLKTYGKSEEYKESCTNKKDYSWFRWSYCRGYIQTNVDPGVSCDNYIDDYLDHNGFDVPSGINEKYFNNHDLIAISFDNYWCGGGFNRIRNVSKNNGVVTIEIGYKGSCGPCAIDTSIILVEVKKGFATATDVIETEEIQENSSHCDPGISYKPMIYIYPEEETIVNINLGRPELLTTTYPKYNVGTGWQVVARPDGTLKEQGSNREYYGLYWEGINSLKQKDDGFIVAGEDTIDFLEEKLEILGLNEREANEFIIYWLPKMEHNKFNYIRFVTSEEIESEMPLEVYPEPKTLIRVLMEYKPLNEKINIKEQKLERVSRSGYTVVEWGGTELK